VFAEKLNRTSTAIAERIAVMEACLWSLQLWGHARGGGDHARTRRISGLAVEWMLTLPVLFPDWRGRSWPNVDIDDALPPLAAVARRGSLRRSFLIGYHQGRALCESNVLSVFGQQFLWRIICGRVMVRGRGWARRGPTRKSRSAGIRASINEHGNRVVEVGDT